MLLRASFISETDNSCAGQSQQNSGVPGEGDTKHHQERELALPCCQAARTGPPHQDFPLRREAKPFLAAHPAWLPWASPVSLCAPFPYGIPGKGLGWDEALSPIAAGLRWSESPDPDMEGGGGMEGGWWCRISTLCLPLQETWAFLEQLLDFFETYISWAKSRVS